MENITRYAVKVGGFVPFADHTYVKSSDGSVWPCFGSSDGGRKICSGTGDSDTCNKLAGSDSHAEISYGKTGVCHQAANRILIPTGQTVNPAWGYSASTALYGVYGTDAKEFFKRHNITTMQLNETPHNNYVEREFISSVKNLYKSSNMMMNTNDDDSIDLASEEFKLLLQYKLSANSSIASNKFSENPTTIPTNKLLEIHKKFNMKKNSLINDLDNKKLSPEEFATKINEEISSTLHSFSQELSREDFEKVFGIKPGDKVMLVDSKIMTDEYKK